MTIEIEFPVKYAFTDYHEAPFYADFLSSGAGVPVQIKELDSNEDKGYTFQFYIE